jgi:hypothetical protein
MRGSRGFSDRCFAKGQLWQVFVGSKERWVHGYYQALLAQQAEVSAEANGIKDPTAVDNNNSTLDRQSSPHSNRSEKWRSQIEKVKGITSIEFYFVCHSSLLVDLCHSTMLGTSIACVMDTVKAIIAYKLLSI